MKKKRSTISSIRSLCKASGKSKTTMLRWIADPAWTFGKPPWPRTIVKRLKAWERDRFADRFAAVEARAAREEEEHREQRRKDAEFRWWQREMKRLDDPNYVPRKPPKQFR